MKKLIALVEGDGSGPEMMSVACDIVIAAGRMDGLDVELEKTPMGWEAYDKWGDTRPEHFFARAKEIGTIFFGGVGDFEHDNTVGVEKPEMKPEPRCLLALRQDMGLLINMRPMIFYKALAHLAGVRPERIPEEGIQQHWIRYLLEDTYFGNVDLINEIPGDVREKLGIKLKKDITGDEEIVTDLGYFKKSTLEQYIRYGLAYARSIGLPAISIDKANVMQRYQFWRINVTRIGKAEFPDVPIKHQYIDSANALLFTPKALHGVIMCGNEHGDIGSDGAAAAVGSMGMMCSSAINPKNGDAMFESGAGTAPQLAGTDRANPIGRILTGSIMLRHLGATNGADAIVNSVNKTLGMGYLTEDLVADNGTEKSNRIVGTQEMGNLILKNL